MAFRTVFYQYVTFGFLSFSIFTLPVIALEGELWNFDNADIETVVKKVSEKTGKNFILDPRVQGKVTVISQHPINTPKEAYQILLALLRVHGYKAIESENVIKVIPQESANNDNGPVSIRSSHDNDHQIIKILSLKYVSPQEILPSIREMIPHTSHIVAIDSTSSLIIADTESNINKVEQILAQIDKKSSHMVNMISLHHASAVEMANTLGVLLREKGGTKFPITIGADERTNSLLISGGTKELRDYIDNVAHQMDAPTDNNYNSEVIYLKYIAASNVAPIVAAFLEESMRSNKDQQIKEEVNKSANTSTVVSPIQNNMSNLPSAPPNHLRALQEYNSNAGQQGSLFAENDKKPQSGIVNRFVQWEESSNALIVKAPATIMRAIKTIIAKLDIRRPQVIIEVIIAEVKLDRVEEYGVEWDVSPNASIKFGTRFFPVGGIVGGLSGGVVDQLGSGLSVGIFRHGSLRALIRMLSSDVSANILSTPTLVTLDNQTALIKVGEKVPFAIGQTNNQNVGGNPFTSYDREEVGLSLTIKPQIVNNNEIKLQIENILSNIIPDTANANTGGNPTTSERTIITNVLVNEGKILVLGGLIQDTWQEVRSKVPFIGSIPWVGQLFKRQNKELVKKNLMIFLRPKIIHDDCKGIRLSTTKYDDMRNAQLASYDVLNEPFVDEPITAPPLGVNDYYKGQVVPEHQVTELILPPPFQ